MSRSLTQAKERGLEHIPETIMSLTYRGLKYNQHKEVVEKDHVKLTYRGKSYQNWLIGSLKNPESQVFFMTWISIDKENKTEIN